jgi:hypothetical protein
MTSPGSRHAANELQSGLHTLLPLEIHSYGQENVIRHLRHLSVENSTSVPGCADACETDRLKITMQEPQSLASTESED